MATRKPTQVPGETTTEDAPATAPTLQDAQADAPAQSGLPRAADIDPTKLSRSVLTQDGWVCPA